MEACAVGPRRLCGCCCLLLPQPPTERKNSPGRHGSAFRRERLNGTGTNPRPRKSAVHSRAVRRREAAPRQCLRGARRRGWLAVRARHVAAGTPTDRGPSSPPGRKGAHVDGSAPPNDQSPGALGGCPRGGADRARVAHADAAGPAGTGGAARADHSRADHARTPPPAPGQAARPQPVRLHRRPLRHMRTPLPVAPLPAPEETAAPVPPRARAPRRPAPLPEGPRGDVRAALRQGAVGCANAQAAGLARERELATRCWAKRPRAPRSSASASRPTSCRASTTAAAKEADRRYKRGARPPGVKGTGLGAGRRARRSPGCRRTCRERRTYSIRAQFAARVR